MNANGLKLISNFSISIFDLNYKGEYESEGDHYARQPDHGRYNSGPIYNGDHGPHKQSGPVYNAGREVKPLSNYMSGRPKKQSNYGPAETYGNNGNGEYSSGPGHEEISVGPEHTSYSVGEIENNHLPMMSYHSLPHKHHKINEIYEQADHIPPYIPSDFPSLSSSIGGGIGNYPNPMELIYSSPYKLSGGPPHHGYGKPSYRPSLLGSASSQSSATANSQSNYGQSNYGQFLSSLLSAYSLGSLKPSKPSSSSKGSGLAGYLNNLPGLDLFKVSL